MPILRQNSRWQFSFAIPLCFLNPNLKATALDKRLAWVPQGWLITEPTSPSPLEGRTFGAPPCFYSLGKSRFLSALQNYYFLGTKRTNTKCLMNSYENRLLLSIFLSLSSWHHILHHLLLQGSVSPFSPLNWKHFLWGRGYILLLSMFLVTSTWLCTL